MKARKRTLSAALAATVLSVAACAGGPGGGDTNQPVGAVNAAIAAAESGGFTELAEFLCEENKDDVAAAFGGGGDLDALAGAGIDPEELFDAVKLDFQDQMVTEVSRADSEATVHLKGTMAMTFDPEALRDMVRQVLAAQGITATDEMIDMGLSTMEDQLSQTQTVDTDIKVVQENGKWVMC